MSNLFHILARNENEPNRAEKVAVIIKNDDLLNGNKRFFAFRENSIYKPFDEFKPELKSGGHKLSGQIVQNYFDMIPDATDAYNKLRNVLENNSGPINSVELDNVKHALELSKNKVREQAEKIALMQVNQFSPNNSQTDQMQKLMDQQMQALKLMNEMKPRVIEIKTETKSTYVTDEVVHEKFASVLKCLAKKRPVFLSGPAGTGKSHIAEQVAKALGLRFYPCSALSQEFKITGYEDANGIYHDTQFRKAYDEGGVFCIDEIDASTPEVLVSINTAISQRYFDFPDGLVHAHPDFRIICAGNTTGNGADNQYTGRYQLDASTLDRFAQIKIGYSEPIEMNIAQGDIELVEFAHAIRKTAEEIGVNLLFSYRAIDNITQLKDDFELDELLQIALIKGLASDDLRQLVRNVRLDNGNKYFKALKLMA